MVVSQDSAGVANGRVFVKALLIVLLLRALTGVILVTWELQTPTPVHFKQDHYHGLDPDVSLFGQLFVKWDSYWYLQLAEHGYQLPSREQPQSNLGFAPLYPFLISMVSRLGMAPAVAGVLISTLCFFALLWYLFQLGCIYCSPRCGAWLMVFVTVFPSSWVLHMVYSEALFCSLLCAFLVYHARGATTKASICAVLLPLARFTGVLLVPALCIDVIYRRWKDRSARIHWREIIAAFLGIAFLLIVFQFAVGHPLAFVKAKHAWFEYHSLQNKFPALIWASADRLRADVLTPWYLLLFAFYVFATIAVVLRDRDVGAWYTCLCILLYFMMADPSGLVRFLLPLIPVHLYVVRMLQNHPRLALLTALFTLGSLILLTRLYLIWRAVA